MILLSSCTVGTTLPESISTYSLLLVACPPFLSCNGRCDIASQRFEFPLPYIYMSLRWSQMAKGGEPFWKDVSFQLWNGCYEVSCRILLSVGSDAFFTCIVLLCVQVRPRYSIVDLFHFCHVRQHSQCDIVRTLSGWCVKQIYCRLTPMACMCFYFYILLHFCHTTFFSLWCFLFWFPFFICPFLEFTFCAPTSSTYFSISDLWLRPLSSFPFSVFVSRGAW